MQRPAATNNTRVGRVERDATPRRAPCPGNTAPGRRCMRTKSAPLSGVGRPSGGAAVGFPGPASLRNRGGLRHGCGQHSDVCGRCQSLSKTFSICPAWHRPEPANPPSSDGRGGVRLVSTATAVQCDRSTMRRQRNYPAQPSRTLATRGARRAGSPRKVIGVVVTLPAPARAVPFDVPERQRAPSPARWSVVPLRRRPRRRCRRRRPRAAGARSPHGFAGSNRR